MVGDAGQKAHRWQATDQHDVVLAHPFARRAKLQRPARTKLIAGRVEFTADPKLSPLSRQSSVHFHHPTVEARDTTARTSLRLLAVLDVLFKYACERLSPSPDSLLVLTALSPTSPRRVFQPAEIVTLDPAKRMGF